MLRIHFIINFLLQILYFKESYNLIGWQHFGLKLINKNFFRYRIGGEIPIAKLVLFWDYFQEKLMTKFFKRSKKTYFGAILGPFFTNLSKNNFSRKKRLCQFLNIPFTYHHTKNQKHLMSHSWEKSWNDRQTDRQTENSDFIGTSIGEGSKNRSKWPNCHK